MLKGGFFEQKIVIESFRVKCRGLCVSDRSFMEERITGAEYTKGMNINETLIPRLVITNQTSDRNSI